MTRDCLTQRASELADGCRARQRRATGGQSPIFLSLLLFTDERRDEDRGRLEHRHAADDALHSADHSLREKTFHRGAIDVCRNEIGTSGEQRAHFGREEKPAVCARNIERFDPKAIASEHDAARAATVHDRQREHSTQMGKRVVPHSRYARKITSVSVAVRNE